MGYLLDAFDKAAAEAPAPTSERSGSLVAAFDDAAKAADAEQKKAKPAAELPIKLDEPPGRLKSALVGVGTAVGRGALSAQQMIGKAAQTIGDASSPQTLNGPQLPPNLLQQSGQWLLQDAREGVNKLTRENAPYAAENPKSNFAGEVAGTVLSPINKVIPIGGPASTVVGAAAKGAGQGAALNALTSPVEDDKHFLLEKAQQAAVGGIGGTLGGVAAFGLSKAIDKGIELFRSATNKFTTGNPAAAAEATLGQALTQNGVNAAQLKTERPELFSALKEQVLEAVKSGRKLDPEELKRLVRFQTLDVPVPYLKGWLNRDPMQYAKEQGLRGIEGVGEPIKETITAANRALFKNLDVMGASRGSDVVTAGKSAIDTLRVAGKSADADVTRAYNEFKKATGRELDVSLKGLAQDYAATIKEFGDAIPAAIRSKFEGLGLMSGTAKSVFSISDAEALIKSINRNYDPSNRVQARALDELRRGVQKAISESAGETAAGAEAAGLAKSAREAAKVNFNLRDATPALKAAIQGHEPDKFIQKFVLQGNVGEIKSMVETLGKQDPKALVSLQDSLMQFIKERVGNMRGEGNATFYSDQLKKFVQDPNMSQRIAQVLGPEKMAKLKQLYQVSEDMLYAPTGSAVNRSNTASQAANLIKSEVQGGSMNAIADLLARYAPVLSGPAQAAKAANQSARGAKLVDEAVNPSLGSQTGANRILELISNRLRPDVASSRAAGAALQERNRREAQR